MVCAAICAWSAVFGCSVRFRRRVTQHHMDKPRINNPATPQPAPIPAFAPVLKPPLGSDVACVAVCVAVPGVPGGRLVDVGSKLLIHVIYPPVVVGRTWSFISQLLKKRLVR